MALEAVLESAFETGGFVLSAAPYSLSPLPEAAHDMTVSAPALGNLIMLVGFLLTLLATFALALLHATQPWRHFSIFLNGIALACGVGLLAGEIALITVPADSLDLLRGAAGLFAAVAVLSLWPALVGLGARDNGRLANSGTQGHALMGGAAMALPLTATPGGPLSLEDALTGSGATIFARAPDLSERWSVPRLDDAAASPPAAPLLERIRTTLQNAFSRQAPVADRFRTDDPQGKPRWYELAVRPGRFSDGQNGAIGLLMDVTRHREAEAQTRHLLQEATHRTKNLLTIIQSVARMSAKTLGLPANAIEPFNARLQAIAMSYDLLVREEWDSVPLTDLLHSQLNHTLGNAAARASTSGPALRLRPTAVQTLALAFHELGAKAMVQGAMAAPGGRLRISWEDATMRDGSPGYRLVWQELGHGPDVPAEHRNYARDILERLTPRGLRGEVAASQTDEGFRWELRFPASNVMPPRQD